MEKRLKILLQVNGHEYLKDNKTKSHDLEIRHKNGNVYKIELKSDFESKKTNNIALELSSRESSSGLNTTSSDFWFHYLWDSSSNQFEFYYCPVDTLKKYIKENLSNIRIVDGGDDKTSRLILIKSKQFISISTKLNSDSLHIL